MKGKVGVNKFVHGEERWKIAETILIDNVKDQKRSH